MPYPLPAWSLHEHPRRALDKRPVFAKTAPDNNGLIAFETTTRHGQLAQLRSMQ
jgi:hypothetical protein